jgi:predicted RND superfamily exporter protein
VLKDPISGLLTMLPNLWPVGVVFGLISWNGMNVDIGTMITASVALGIAIDGTLHLLTWFRQGLREGRSREDSIALAMGHCAPAMWQTSMIVGLGMFILSFADLLLVSRFGWLMAALIGAATFADLVLLPAMLAGSLGKFIERRITPDDAEPTPEPADTPDSRATQPSSAVREPHLQSFSETDRKMLRKDSGMSPNT